MGVDHSFKRIVDEASERMIKMVDKTCNELLEMSKDFYTLQRSWGPEKSLVDMYNLVALVFIEGLCKRTFEERDKLLGQ